jgi:hypothetical protein
MRSGTVIADIPFESRVDSFPALSSGSSRHCAGGARPILLGGRVRLVFMT